MVTYQVLQAKEVRMKVWRLMAHHSSPIEAAQVYKDEGFVAVGWGHTGDLKQLVCESHEGVSKKILETWPEANNAPQGGRVLWGFLNEMTEGDQVIIGIPGGRRVQVMEILGAYYWEPGEDEILMNYQHRRPARCLDVDPDDLWGRFSGVAHPWNIRWALGLCGEIEETLERVDISRLVARYRAERARFEKLASEIQRRVTDRLRDKGIRNMVASRPKAPESLMKKLWKERGKRRFRDFENALSPPLKDLAGVRVLLYLPEDIQPTVETLKDLFEVREAKSHDQPDGYRAEHLYVSLESSEELEEELHECCSLLCEIQICTITDHIWNELEHDIIYKQPGGSPDEGQKELLISLHHMLGIASGAVDRLMTRTKARIQENSEPILEPEGLQGYLNNRFKRTVRGDFGSLLDLLKTLMAEVTPAALDKLFQDGWQETTAQNEARRFDPNGSEKEVGWMAMMLLPILGYQNIIDATERDDLSPLSNMIRRAAEAHSPGRSA